MHPERELAVARAGPHARSCPRSASHRHRPAPIPRRATSRGSPRSRRRRRPRRRTPGTRCPGPSARSVPRRTALAPCRTASSCPAHATCIRRASRPRASRTGRADGRARQAGIDALPAARSARRRVPAWRPRATVPAATAWAKCRSSGGIRARSDTHSSSPRRRCRPASAAAGRWPRRIRSRARCGETRAGRRDRQGQWLSWRKGYRRCAGQPPGSC